MTDEQMKYYNEGVEQGYKDGKEDLTMITRHRDSLKIEVEIKEAIIEKLNKENEELKAQTEEQAKEIADLRNTLCSALKTIKENKDKWKYLEGRFVEVNECSEEQRLRCPMYEDMYCDGTNCKSFIDLVALLESACEKGDVK